MPHPQQTPNYKDPFTAGQMVGMLVMIQFIQDRDQDVPDEVLERLKMISATNIEEYFEKPTEDILLMIDNIVKEIKV